MIEKYEDPIQLAYFAGLMDGEGTWSIQVNRRLYKGKPHVHFNPRISMTLKNGNQVLDKLVDRFGGNVYDYSERRMRRWSLGGRENMIKASEEMLPYLEIKREICEKFLEALYIFPKTRKAHVNGERSWTDEMTSKVAYIALTLNSDGSGHSPKTLEYLEELKTIYATDGSWSISSDGTAQFSQ